MRSALRLTPVLALGLALPGCARDVPAWAVQHGSIVPASDGASGYQTWELYAKQWRKKHKEKFHICADVEAFAATEVDPLAGCEDCTTYALDVEPLESDCPAAVDFGAPTHFAVGLVPSDLEGEDPYPGKSLGWYVSWDGQVVEPMGYAWHEDLELVDRPTSIQWEDGAPFVLWPAYAWDLGE